MGKAIGKIGKVAGVVAGVALVASGVGAPFGGALLASTLATVGAVAGAVSAAASMIARKPSLGGQQAARDRLTASLVPDQPRRAALGATALNTDVRYQAYTGTDQSHLDQIVCVASHAVTSIDELWLDNELAWTASGGAQGRFAGYLTVTPRLVGTSGNGIAIDGVWTASATLTGCAYVHIRYRLTGTSKKAESPFASGVSGRMTIRGKGAPDYDPRFDSTAGGSGPQRAGDQSTWAYDPPGAQSGRNPALHLLWYLLGWRIEGKLALGRGFPPSRIDMASFITAANVCDELVTKAAGGTEPRYRGDGVFGEADDPAEVIAALCGAMAGRLRDSGGRIALHILVNDLATPVVDLGADDIMGEERWEQTGSFDQAVNAIRGRYTDASDAALYQPVDAPQPAPLASPDGIERTDSYDLLWVQSPSQWQRLAKQRLQRAQYQGVYSGTFKSRGWAALQGRVVRLTHPTLGWTNKLFRVDTQAIRLDGTVPLRLIEEHPAIYAWDAEEAPAVVAASPTAYDATNAPLVRGIADAEAAAAALAADIAALDAAVDGKVTTFFQPSPPAAEGVGDLWFDTDDGNALHRWSGSAWVPAADGDIASAITAAAGAQATADGKIATYNQQAQPASPSIGDLWVQPSASPKILRRWNGTAWVEVSNLILEGAQIGVENGADVTSQVTGVATIEVKADHTGAPLAGQLPRNDPYKLIRNGVDVTAAASWSAAVASGGWSGSIGAATGVLATSALTSDAVVRVSAVYGTTTRRMDVKLTRTLAAPPVSGGSGGGSGGSAASDTSLAPIASASMAAVSDELTVTIGSMGQATLSFAADVSTGAASPAGTYEVRAIWQWWDGAAWVDQGSETASDPDAVVTFDGAWLVDAGYVAASATKTGLTAGASHKFRVRARNTSGTRTMYLSGQASVQG